MLGFTQWQTIGFATSAFGVFFFVLGVLMFLDRALLAMGNIMFLSGIPMVVGVSKTLGFFSGAWRGSAMFLTGLCLLLYGWTLVGLFIEAWGFLNLFGGFFPEVATVLCRLPFVGTYFSMFFALPPVRMLADLINRVSGNIPMPAKGP